jgi:hypothetical protein
LACLVAIALSGMVEIISHASQPFIISEFLTKNGGGLTDADGDTPDWIEIANVSAARASLGGWHLTDDAANLVKWTFPETNLNPGQTIVVFASNKDRTIPGGELHTNFELDEAGEFLALVEPNGTTVAHSFSPTYPPQKLNVSYGVRNNSTAVLSVDFNDDDSGESGEANTEPGFSPMTLTSNPASFNGISLTLSSLGGVTLDDRDRAAPLETASLTQDQLYDDFIYAPGTTDGYGIRLIIAGLPPNQDYTLKVWSVDAGGSTVGNRTSDWIETASGTINPLRTGYSFDISSPPVVDGDNTFTAPVRSAANGRLQIEARRNGGVSSGVYLNALQLFSASNSSAGEEALYFKPPTPGTANGSGFEGLVADTKFSVDRGYKDEPISVAITTATAGARIYWTTNGSEPRIGSGTLYTTPVEINGTTLLRAAAFLDNYIPSDVDTHSYIYLRQVLQQPSVITGYPTTWQASFPADYAMDPNIVGHSKYGVTLSNDLRSLPVLSVVTPHDSMWGSANGIYNHSTSTGAQWERAASVELIAPDGDTEFAINCGVEMQGNASRDNVRTPKHSMRLSFESQYGATKLDYEWFPGPVRQFETIVLRGCGFADAWPSRYSDTNPIAGTGYIGTRYRPETATYLKDPWMKASFRAMGHLAARSAFVHLYINGLYWGLYNPSERLDASFFAAHLGGREGDWDVMAGDDTYNFAEVRDGTKDSWNGLMELVKTSVQTEEHYRAVAEVVDIENLIDYMLVHILGEAEDWPFHNWYAARRRATNGVPATKWIFTVWDQEIGLDRLVRRDRVNVSNEDTPAKIYSQLRSYPEFRRLFGDRVQKHLLQGGVLSPEQNIARMDGLADKIRRALVAESARWGDAREFPISPNPGTGKTFTPDEWWEPELAQLRTNLFPGLNATTIARLRSNGLFPGVDAPVFSQFGGPVSGDFALAISNPNGRGVVYYTVDGADPREYGTAAVSATAQPYTQNLNFIRPTTVRARVLVGTVWSALAEASFYPPQDFSGLRLTELMYHPPRHGTNSEDELEFIELQNAGTNTLNLSGLTFSQGIIFTFPQGATVEPGEFVLLARNLTAITAKYPGLEVDGIYSGKLSDSGETITLSAPGGATIFSLSYSDGIGWPETADGFGFSLVPRDFLTSQAPDSARAWRASTTPGGSPGSANEAPIIAPIVINELLTHTDLPQVDAVELYNPTPTNVFIGGWLLTDDRKSPWKYVFPPSTEIPANGYLVVTETNFNASPGSEQCFSLSSSGEGIVLFSADTNANLTGYSHSVEFGASFNGVSFGRWVSPFGEEFFPAQIVVTLGTSNVGPSLGPVVLTEIHYHPAANDEEFLELLNISTNTVSFHDLEHPTNTWRLGGVDYDFPRGFTLAPGGMVLLVGSEPSAFATKYNVPAEVTVLGPWSGNLQDGGENLELQAPDSPNEAQVPYVAVEAVRYNDRAPWPAMADGSGLSLQRQFPVRYGNDPSQWVAASPTPGRTLASADSDGDTLPDEWEWTNGTNPYVADADADPDADGYSNIQEYIAGTHPNTATSALKLEVEIGETGGLQLRFAAIATHSYSLLSASAPYALWTRLQDYPATASNSVISFEGVVTETNRFYRVVTPALD